MDILDKFGFNPMLFLAQIVNFLIILFILKKILYKPVLSMLKKRKDDINEGLKNAEEGNQLLKSAEEKEKEILQKAESAANQLVAEAKAEAAAERAITEEATRKETEKMLSQAREQIEQETKAAEERLTKNIGGIAIALLEKSLTGIFGDKEQKLILKKATAELQK